MYINNNHSRYFSCASGDTTNKQHADYQFVSVFLLFYYYDYHYFLFIYFLLVNKDYLA